MLAAVAPGRSRASPTPPGPPRHQASLAAAEHAFSDRAQQIGLRAAFREYGRPDAINMLDGAAFPVGLDAIAQGFPEGVATSPAQLVHRPRHRRSSGDLGV